MIEKIIWLIILTFVPGLELRWSIPIGIYSGALEIPIFGSWQGFNLPIEIVFVVVVITNILLGPFVYLMLKLFLDFFIRFNFFKKAYDFFVLRTQKKTSKLVEKYGVLGIAIFIAIPLPGSGSYTGALAAHLFGMRKRDFFIANLIGVIIAGIIVTILSVGLFSFI